MRRIPQVAFLASNTPGTVRQPRGMVRINKTPVQGWLDWEIESNNYREADTFRVTFALSKLVAPFDEAWFAAQTTINVELLGGFPPDPTNFGASDLDSLIIGNVDEVSYDPAQRTLELSGRDLTSLLIDAKTAEKWQNQTASEVASTLAKRHGLTPVVKATTDTLGRFYQIDHVSTTTVQTEWDFLCWIAQQTQFVVYVKGMELHFEPQADPSNAPRYPITWTPADATQPFGSNTIHMSFTRTLTVGNTISVTVRSWNVKQRKGFTASYPRGHAKGIRPGTATQPAQAYSYIIPNLTQDQATKRAQAIYNEIIKNEMRMSASLPGDNVLTPLSVIPVSGTGTVFDQNYFPESITRRMSFGSGYTMDVRCRNHSTDAQPA
jgi:phage protein D